MCLKSQATAAEEAGLTCRVWTESEGGGGGGEGGGQPGGFLLNRGATQRQTLGDKTPTIITISKSTSV